MGNPCEPDLTDAQLLAAALACVDSKGVPSKSALLVAERAYNTRLAAEVMDHVLRSTYSARLIEVAMDWQPKANTRETRVHLCELYKALNGARWFECCANGYRYRWSTIYPVQSQRSLLCATRPCLSLLSADDVSSRTTRCIHVPGEPVSESPRVVLHQHDQARPAVECAACKLDMSEARHPHSAATRATGGAPRAT